MRPPRARQFLAWLLGCLPLAAQALPQDKDQPIHIEADEAAHDERARESHYRGQVEIRQGSLHISADAVTIFHASSQADRIVARGKPARLRTQREAGGEPIRAEGGTIEYDRQRDRMHIRQNAKLEQDGSTVRSDSIEYLVDQGLVKAASEAPAAGDGGSRVRVVIPPGRLEEARR